MARDRAARPGAKALRLFVAIEIPEAAKDAVEAAVAPLRTAFPKARWVPRENWHVTLKFLGQTWPRLEEWVRAQVGGAAAASVGLDSKLEGIGSFPSSRRARVVWAGLDDRAGRMAEIAHALDVALAKEFKPEKRAFTPHLTVARSDPPLSLPASFGEIQVEPVGFRVERLTLFRSHLQRPAPRYEPLESFPLGG
jgi:2'-5' RNA ligase